jgi:SAM-dependent methyltransferase
MKELDEIKDIIVNQLGIKDQETYKAWCEAYNTGRKPITNADVELLSPDNVNNTHFWQVVEELFGSDCVGNSLYGALPNSPLASNLRNLTLARLSGALNFVDEWKHYSMPILEIGAGYGNFQSYILYNTAMKYTGVDVVPRAHDIIQLPPTGLLPEEVTGKNFFIVYSSNVFQHFSAKQRSQYYKDIAQMLLPNGLFIVNMMVHYWPPEKLPIPAEDGKNYLRHYGQFTEIPFYPQLMDELTPYFHLDFETRGYRNYQFTFVLRSKKEEPKKEVTPVEANLAVANCAKP